jgi:hypothetical protein
MATRYVQVNPTLEPRLIKENRTLRNWSEIREHRSDKWSAKAAPRRNRDGQRRAPETFLRVMGNHELLGKSWRTEIP